MYLKQRFNMAYETSRKTNILLVNWQLVPVLFDVFVAIGIARKKLHLANSDEQSSDQTLINLTPSESS